MMHTRCLIGLLSVALLTGCSGGDAPSERAASPEATEAGSASYAETYARIAYANYKDSHDTAVKLRKAIDTFLADPTKETLAAAKQAWLVSRDPYGQTEAYRFYEGPIDFADAQTGAEGPEGQLNAWPLNEAYIDYVKGNADAGIINQADVTITKQTLVERNAAQDEANVTTGYHAIEFLLWGQDLSLDSAGQRPVSDYTPGTPANDRRREYLKVVTDLLVEDLQSLVDAWAPDRDDNYRTEFLAMDKQAQLTKTMTGLATLSGFELASERIAVALDSGDQENEHSCFADNTHNDILYNAQGVWNVCVGEYGDVSGKGLLGVIADADAALADKLKQQLGTTMELAKSLPVPIDRALATPPGSPERQKLEQLVASLQQQAKLLVEAGEKLGVEVIVAAE